jgi:hypothetical protein
VWEDQVQNWRKWFAVVAKGCVTVRQQPSQAMRYVGRLGAPSFCREDIKGENCTIRKMNDRAMQKTEGQNAMLEDKLSADTFLDGCIQKIGS